MFGARVQMLLWYRANRDAIWLVCSAVHLEQNSLGIETCLNTQKGNTRKGNACYEAINKEMKVGSVRVGVLETRESGQKRVCSFWA
jgi:hypothetical protein